MEELPVDLAARLLILMVVVGRAGLLVYPALPRVGLRSGAAGRVVSVGP